MFLGGVRLGVWGVVLVVCVYVSVSGVLFSVGVCVCDLLICLHDAAKVGRCRVCVSVSGVLFSVGVCVCDLLIFLSFYITPLKLAASGGAFGLMLHLVVILRRRVKNSSAPSPVMSCSPNLERVPSIPPKEKGSRGTGTPMLTPTIPALNRRATRGGGAHE